MKKYIGTKVIMAEPMTMTEAQKVLGKELKPATVEEDGYLVEYNDGYKSWSPKSVFEEAYKPSETVLDRLKIEYAELNERREKLEAFLKNGFSEVIKKVGTQQAALLLMQSNYMKDYLEILYTRIKLMEENNENNENNEYKQ